MNEDLAYAVGRAYSDFVMPETVVVGHDNRSSSPMLSQALVAGLIASGVQVHHLGTCGTEEVYFSTAHFKFDGGIMVTASHNPKDYNGMKLVQREARPISADTGLNTIRDAVQHNRFAASSTLATRATKAHAQKGGCIALEHRPAYIQRLLDLVDRACLKPLRLLVNPGHGCAGAIIDCLSPHLPVTFVPLHFDADGDFPMGVPNPLLPENRQPTQEAIISSHADLGIAWDGDFDRCFFFDEAARYIESYYIVGILARAFLERAPNSTIVHDPRLVWNTVELVNKGRGRSVQSKAGHAFMKETMRRENAIYGGEMSGHHYFRDFAFCDSGMLPWLMLVELMSREDKKLSELVGAHMASYPVSGEINRQVDAAAELLVSIEKKYRQEALSVQHIDGLSVECAEWRFNLRLSNTESVLRLNVETKANPELLQEKTHELLALIGGGE